MHEERPESRNEPHLRSVNWEHGMLLTPEHFLRQERYLESIHAWSMRYLSAGAGLAGGGIRLPESDLGTVRFDPEVHLHETAEALEISVVRARGVTPSGVIVDVETAGAVSARLPKEQLAGVAEALIWVVCDPGTRLKADGVPDAFNPQMRSERIASYRVTLHVSAAERATALAVGRVRRPASGMYFEADPRFIPPCLSVAAHSELMAGTRRILDAVNRLASRYAELHRAMREFMILFTERGLDTEVDRDSIEFAERMVLELHDTAYMLLDRTQTPERFFSRVRRTLHTAAIFFDLASGMQGYYEMLRETGESDLPGLIEMQKHTLEMGRTLRLDENLGAEVQKALAGLGALERLERALEGKYIDFRRSASLPSTNFIFDRGGKALYKLAARPARVGGIADEMTIFFSNLRLEGRDRYRLILVGDRNAPWVRGVSIGAEVRINEGSGFRRESLILTGEVKLDEQRNMELDFEAPDVPTITDLRVTVPAYHAVHTALLFMRHRFYSGQREPGGARLLERGSGEEAANVEMPPSYPENGSGRESRLEAPMTARSTPTEDRGGAVQPPWAPSQVPSWTPRETPGNTENRNGDTADAPKPRRRRLE